MKILGHDFTLAEILISDHLKIHFESTYIFRAVLNA